MVSSRRVIYKIYRREAFSKAFVTSRISAVWFSCRKTEISSNTTTKRSIVEWFRFVVFCWIFLHSYWTVSSSTYECCVETNSSDFNITIKTTNEVMKTFFTIICILIRTTHLETSKISANIQGFHDCVPKQYKLPKCNNGLQIYKTWNFSKFI